VSVEAITWALRQPVKPSSRKFVLVVLANCASGDTFLAYPSIAYLCEATGQDRKTVMTNLAALRDCGLLEDTGQRAGSTKQVIVYRVLCGPDLFCKGAQKRDSSENGTVPKFPPNSTVFPGEQSQKRDTETSVTVSNRQKKESAPDLDFTSWPSPPSPQVLADWLSHRKAKRALVTATVLETFGRELHKAVAAGWTVDEALGEAMQRNWQGLNAEWLQPKGVARIGGTSASANESKTLLGMKAIQGMKHGNGLVRERDHRRADEAVVLVARSLPRLGLGSDHGGDVD